MRPNRPEVVLEKVSPEPMTGCWLWTGALGDDGYALVKLGGRTVRAARVSLELKLGRSLSSAEEACHRCDFPACMNPEHLFAGTRSDNHRDMLRKGRGKIPTERARGERHGTRTHPEMVRRGPAHRQWGKPCHAPRDPITGRFLPS